MTIHILIACSKSKSVLSEPNLHWNHDSSIGTWSKTWSAQDLIHEPQDLYTGRSFKQQYDLIRENENTRLYVISAGAGLICPGDRIPSYDATFIRNQGPSTKDWYNLPKGGVGGMSLKSGDCVVSFAPPKYHKALLHDPDLHLISDLLIVPSTSPLALEAKTVIEIHPRSKEVLKVSSTDLNTKFLEIFLTEGVEGFRSINTNADSLPSLVNRTTVTDEELHTIVGDLTKINSNAALVRYLRDDLRIKASVERITAARKKVNQETQDG